MGSVLNSLWNRIQLEPHQCQEGKANFGGVEQLIDNHLGSSVDGAQFLNLDAVCDNRCTDIDSEDDNHTLSAERYKSMIDSCQTTPQNVCGTDSENGVGSKIVTAPVCDEDNRPSGPVIDEENRPGGPVIDEENRPGGPVIDEENRPGGPVFDEENRPGGPVIDEENRPGGPVIDEENRPGGPVIDEENRPGGPVFDEENRPGGPVIDEENRPGGPVIDEENRPGGPVFDEENRPGGPVIDEENRPGGPVIDEENRPGGPVIDEENRPGGPVIDEENRPGGPVIDEENRPSGPVIDEENRPSGPVIDEENRPSGPVFDPPLYLQRYSFMADKLNSLNVQSVVDFGCAECQLSRFLADVASIQRIAMVDMDRPLLQAHKYNIKPAVYHFLDKRKHPLTIQVYHGDATVLDTRLIGYDAVSMVEFIEHLYPDDLQKVCHMVFHELQPRIIIMTTPNFEFNQLFPADGRTFRHYDHKFEWTREEFQSWGDLLAGIHGYTVQYTGIGDPPPESNHLGYCSQAAIFEKIQIKKSIQRDEKCAQSYTLIAEAVYPYKSKEDALSPSEVLSMEAQYTIRELIKGDNYLELEPDRVVIHFNELMRYKYLAKMCKNNIAILRDHFVDKAFLLTDDRSGIIVCPTEYFETEKFRCELYENGDWDINEDDEHDSDEVKEVMSSKSGSVIESGSHEECWD